MIRLCFSVMTIILAAHSEDILQRVSRASSDASSTTWTDTSNPHDSTDYHHRAQLPKLSDRIRKMYGVASHKMNSEPINVQNYRNEDFDESEWVPMRSTIGPPVILSRKSNYRLKQPRRPRKKSARNKNRKKTAKGVKAYTPVVVEDGAANLLAKIFENEKPTIRQALLIKKINEAERMIEEMETIRRNKQHHLPEGEHELTKEEELAKRIEGTQRAIQNKLRQSSPLQYSIKDGILYRGGVEPVARIGAAKKISWYPLRRNSRARGIINVSGDTQIKYSLAPTMDNSQMSSMRLKNTLTNSTFVHVLGHKATATSSAPMAMATTSTSFDTEIPSTTNDVIEETETPPPYPFSHCYMNQYGFMCCNRYLESLISKSYLKLKRKPNFSSCSIQKIAARIQGDCEQVFNTTFEVIVSLDDFALRAHFAGDLMCKLEQDGRFITAYSTKMPQRDGVSMDPLHVVTPMILNLKDSQTSQLDAKVLQITKDEQPPVRRSIPVHELSRERIDNEKLFSNDIRA